MSDLYHALGGLFGLDPHHVNFWQMAMRAAFIYVSSLIIVRFGDKRFLGKSTAFDIILGIIIGSVFSRAINGSSPLFVTISAGITLVGLHWLFALFSLNNKKFGKLIKGSTSKIINKSTPDPEKMKRGHVTEDDLEEQYLVEYETEIRKIKLLLKPDTGISNVLPGQVTSDNPFGGESLISWLSCPMSVAALGTSVYFITTSKTSPDWTIAM